MNLLTPQLKAHARTQLVATALWRVGALLLTEGIAIAIMLLIGQTLIERSFAVVVERSSLVLRGDSGISQRVRTMNELLLALEQLHTHYTPWTHALTTITDRVPTTIALATIMVDERANLRMEGHATTREALLAFRDGLQGLPFLRDIAVPFSNILQRERIDFSIDARVEATAITPPTTPL